jgi:hypothetical protein
MGELGRKGKERKGKVIDRRARRKESTRKTTT